MADLREPGASPDKNLGYLGIETTIKMYDALSVSRPQGTYVIYPSEITPNGVTDDYKLFKELKDNGETVLKALFKNIQKKKGS